ncbi:MAG TPA: sigma-70 family RNA polymerase sigma factor [Acidobacteriaceae bacterium]|nr:sigma-70 family RNA polymerase sigma factor [Acidobacteriaceae bacterium]
MMDNDRWVEPAAGDGSANYMAFTELFQQNRNRLLRVAMRITRNQEEAEDVVQEAALRALGKLHGFRGESRIDTWIYAIIANSAINRLRSPSRRRDVPLDVAMTNSKDLLSFITSDCGMNPERYCVRYELHEILRTELDGLKASYRSAIQLCDLDGCSYIEAANALNVHLAAFKARLFRGRRVLRERLRERILVGGRSAILVKDRRLPSADGLTHKGPRRARSKKKREAERVLYT